MCCFQITSYAGLISELVYAEQNVWKKEEKGGDLLSPLHTCVPNKMPSFYGDNKGVAFRKLNYQTKLKLFSVFFLAEIGVCISKVTVKILFHLLCRSMAVLVSEIRHFSCLCSWNHTRRHKKKIDYFKCCTCYCRIHCGKKIPFIQHLSSLGNKWSLWRLFKH